MFAFTALVLMAELMASDRTVELIRYEHLAQVNRYTKRSAFPLMPFNHSLAASSRFPSLPKEQICSVRSSHSVSKLSNDRLSVCLHIRQNSEVRRWNCWRSDMSGEM